MYDDNENFKMDLFDESKEEEIDNNFDTSSVMELYDEEKDNVNIDNINLTDQESELDVNRRNREDFEQLMRDSSTQLDGYWDKNNPIVQMLLFGLLGVIIIGSAIVFFSYYAS